MRIKADSPLQVAPIVTSARPPTPEIAIVVKTSYRLQPDGVMVAVADVGDGLPFTGDTFADDDEERSGACLLPSDLAERKLSAEVIVVGHAYSPGGAPVTELPLLVKVGAWSKMLRAVGRRVFTEGVVRSTSAPAPFSKTPLDWRQAFGGAGFDDNPAGRGLVGPELPTLEHPQDPIASRSTRHRAAALGPINPAWRLRASKVGTEYGAQWAAERKPFRSVDFDWRYFSAAPPDQWLEGYLQGDEEVVLQNLNPTHPVLRSRLPGRRIRAFVKDDQGRVREAPVVLDTVLVDTDRALVALTWRGHLPVRERDLSDVRVVWVGNESQSERPQPEDHYRERIAAFEKDPAGLREAVPAQYHAAFFKDDPPPGPKDDGGVMALLDAKLPGAFGDDRKTVAAASERAQGDERVKEAVASAVAGISAQADDQPPVPPARPGGFPEMHLRHKMRSVLEQTARLRGRFEGLAIPPAHLEKLRQLEALPHDPKWRTFDPEYTPPIEPISTDLPGPKRDLSEQDLTGRDLSGVDLSGADLRQTILIRANLSNANLSGANLRGAILFRADLRGANLGRADLTRANVCRALLDGATLAGARLEQAFFDRASAKVADFSRAEGGNAMFMKARLDGAKFTHADLPLADFTEAWLEGASLERAHLIRSAFADVHARGADLTDADISGAGLHRGDWTGARLVGCRAEHTFFRQAILDGADLSFALLTGADLTEASAKAAIFYGANLREARLYRAWLADARFERANLFSADLCHARVDRVTFRDASLYDARLLGTSGADTHFEGAVLHRSTLVRG